MPDGSLIGVTNIQGTNENIPGNVLFYKAGSATPCATVSHPNWDEMFFGGFDARRRPLHRRPGTAVRPSRSSARSRAVAMRRRSKRSAPGTASGNPAALRVDRNGDVSLQDQSSAIYTYAPPVERFARDAAVHDAAFGSEGFSVVRVRPERKVRRESPTRSTPTPRSTPSRPAARPVRTFQGAVRRADRHRRHPDRPLTSEHP